MRDILQGDALDLADIVGVYVESEAHFQERVVALAESLGWFVDYVPDWQYRLIARDIASRRRGDRRWPKPPGFPDLRLARGSRFMLRELKSDKGSLRACQRDWRDRLLAAGVDWALWRPKLWTMIELELA